MDREAEFLNLVYGAAIEPDRWSGVLEGMTGLMGAASANITFQDQVTGQGRAAVFGTDPKLFDSYFGYYATRNPLLKITDFPMALRVMSDEDKIPKNEFVRSEYYNDFLSLMEAHSILIFRLAIEGHNTTVLNLVRPENRERFDSEDLETARRLHPHLIRAFQLSSKLANMQGLKDQFEDFAQGSASAVFVVNAKGKLLYANRAGETMFVAGGGFTLSNGVLRAADTDGTRALHALIGAASMADAGKRKGGEMALVRPDGRRPLSITVIPARSPRVSLFQAEPSVLICAIDPGANVVVPEQRLRDLFGLSRAEARLALQLLNGHDAKTAAKRLGLSHNTVRAHLVRMMAKTGTNRQAELIRIMMRSHD